MPIGPEMLKAMKIIILCDQTDCKYCKGGYTAHDYTWENRCTNLRPKILDYHCESKDTSKPIGNHGDQTI